MNRRLSIYGLMLLSVMFVCYGCARSMEGSKEQLTFSPAGQSPDGNLEHPVDADLENSSDLFIYIPPAEDAESVYYFNNCDWSDLSYHTDDDFYNAQREKQLRETLQISPYIDAEKRDALIRKYLSEHGITRKIPDGASMIDGRPLLEFYRDEYQSITCIVLHAWGMFYKDLDAITKAHENGTCQKLSKDEQETLHETELKEVIYCTTVQWAQLKKIGRLVHNQDENPDIMQETFYDSEDRRLAAISYESMEGVPFPIITSYEKGESGRDGKVSYAVTDILNRTQRFWLFKDLAEWDEAGRLIRYNGCLKAGSRAQCFYDEKGRLQTIEEESDEFGEYFSSGDITFYYRDDGSLDIMKYFFITVRRNTYDSSGTAYYDEQGRMIYRTFYVSNGSRYRFYLYNEDEKMPWACMELCSQAYNSDDDETAYGNECSIYIFQ